MAKDGKAAPGAQNPPETSARHQLDLFVAFVGDVPLRDDREGMSVPLVSLSKSKRTAPIEWRSSDGERFVRVTAVAEHGVATIWDMDVLIWAVSQVNAAIEAGREASPLLRFQPYDMLKAIGRDTGGTSYGEIEAALNRLAGTLVTTNVRTGGKTRKAVFHLLDGWEHITDDATGRSKGMTLTLPRWVYDGVVQHRDVLAISPRYFDLQSGIARWLYRLARRHAGKQATGWRFTMKGLHERSGSTQPLKEFARGVRAAVAKGVPEYRLDLLRGQTGEEMVAMVRDPAKAELPQRRDLTPTLAPPVACSGDGHGGSPAARHGGSPAETRGITRRNRRQVVESKG
jgi:plasmid replication initiation protein